MARKVIFASADLNAVAAIGAEFSQVIEDGDLKLVQTTVRRVVMPDQDIDAQCDDLDAYFAAQGYPAITAADRQSLRDMRTAAEANPEMMARRDQWLADQAANAAAMVPPAAA